MLFRKIYEKTSVAVYNRMKNKQQQEKYECKCKQIITKVFFFQILKDALSLTS